MGQYNPNRMKYQLEKLEKVDQLMSIWGIHDEQFVDQINLVIKWVIFKIFQLKKHLFF